MNPIKEAADRLLSKGDITGKEYNSLNFDNIEKIAKLKSVKSIFTYLKAQAKHPKMSGTIPVEFLRKTIVPALFVTTATTLAKESIVDPIVDATKMQSSYSQLTKKIPQLAEKDQDQIKDYFNVIKTFSPKAASNPLVAGALVNKMMEFGGVDHKLVQDIASIESGGANLMGVAKENVLKNVIKAAVV